MLNKKGNDDFYLEINRTAWDELIDFLDGIREEKGGIGIGYKTQEKSVVLGFCIFYQLYHSSTFCEFDIRDMNLAISLLIDLKEKFNIKTAIGVTAWVHTHPNLGIFLSGTDMDTLYGFSCIDRRIVALVVDAVDRSRLKYGALRFENLPERKEKKVKCVIREDIDFENFDSLWREFRRNLLNRLTEEGRAPEHVTKHEIERARIAREIISPIYFEEVMGREEILKEIISFHREVIKNKRKRVFLKEVRGEAFSSAFFERPNDILNGSRDTYLDLCQSENHYFMVAIPTSDALIERTNLPLLLRKPLVKAIDGYILGYESGVRSALLFAENEEIIYRLKGCGYLNLGVILEENKYVSGKPYYEMRGCQFQGTCLREQINTLLLREKLKNKAILIGNKSLGWWCYFDYAPINAYCGLFITEGDLRLKEDIIFSIEKLLPILFKSIREEQLPSGLIERKYKPACYCLYENVSLIELQNNDLFVIDEFDWIKETDDQAENIRFLKKLLAGEKIHIGKIYWKLGTQAGYIKRILEEEQFVWGTFLDYREVYHCNAHCDNFILNINNEDYLDLSIIDLDLSFWRQSFIQYDMLKNNYDFDNLLKIEKWWLKRDIVDELMPIKNNQRSPELPELYDTLRKGLRETMLAGYDYGYKEKKCEKLSIKEIIFLLLCCYEKSMINLLRDKSA